MVAGDKDAPKRQVERLSGAVGQDDPRRVGDGEQGGNRFPGLEQQASRLQGPTVPTASRRSADLPHGMHDRLVDGFRLGMGCCRIIEIDGHGISF